MVCAYVYKSTNLGSLSPTESESYDLHIRPTKWAEGPHFESKAKARRDQSMTYFDVTSTKARVFDFASTKVKVV